MQNTPQALAVIAVASAGFCLNVSTSAAQNVASQTNARPPSGWIYDFAGQDVPHGLPPQGYSIPFTASLTNTVITYAFRDDPDFFLFSDVSVTDITTGSSVNLIANGDFSGGVHANWSLDYSIPDGWFVQNRSGPVGAGEVIESSSCGSASGYCWVDGAIQAYDTLGQTIATTIGDAYRISFDLTEDGSLSVFQQVSTNGDTINSFGNGIDLLVYAQADEVQLAVPEPSVWALMLTGFAGLAIGGRRTRRGAIAAA